MNRLFDMMGTWPPLGQGVFLLLLTTMTYGTAVGIVKYLTVMVRGWPPPGCEVEQENEEQE
jgi:hypothetical protein